MQIEVPAWVWLIPAQVTFLICATVIIRELIRRKP